MVSCGKDIPSILFTQKATREGKSLDTKTTFCDKKTAAPLDFAQQNSRPLRSVTSLFREKLSCGKKGTGFCRTFRCSNRIHNDSDKWFHSVKLVDFVFRSPRETPWCNINYLRKWKKICILKNKMLLSTKKGNNKFSISENLKKGSRSVFTNVRYCVMYCDTQMVHI